MNKRGQIYIIAALILSVVIFLLISQTNFVQRILIEDDFEQLSKNFGIESAKFMNNLLASGENMENLNTIFKEFADEFSEYAWVENPSFEFIYILDYGGKRLFGNYMNDAINTVGGEEIPGIGSTPASLSAMGVNIRFQISEKNLNFDNFLETGSEISEIIIKDIKYTLDITEGSSLVIISREEKGEQTKIYLDKEFIKGERSQK